MPGRARHAVAAGLWLPDVVVLAKWPAGNMQCACLTKSLPLSILLLDVDHFKQVNDTFGHDAGDVVLRTLAHRVKGTVREGDVVCRFGGEELVLILMECDKQSAFERAEKINAEVRLLDVRHGAQQIGRVTASLGVATFPEDGDDVASLLQAADRAMYIAKNSGRDRVVLAGTDFETP